MAPYTLPTTLRFRRVHLHINRSSIQYKCILWCYSVSRPHCGQKIFEVEFKISRIIWAWNCNRKYLVSFQTFFQNWNSTSKIIWSNNVQGILCGLKLCNAWVILKELIWHMRSVLCKISLKKKVHLHKWSICAVLVNFSPSFYHF